MKLLTLLRRAFSARLLLAILVSIISGVSMATLVTMLSRQITTPSPFNLQLLNLFGLVTLLAILADLTSKWLMTGALGDAGYQLRIALAHQLLAKPYPQLEALGVARLQALFTEDTQQIGLALQQLPQIVLSLSTLVCTLLYLGWLAPAMLGYLVLLAIPTIGGYALLQRRATTVAKAAQKEQNGALRHYRALVEGIKELKLHTNRRYAFLTELLQPATAASQRQNTRAYNWRSLAGTWSQSIYFVFILGVLALAAWRPADNAVIATYALIILYMKSALTLLLTNTTQWHTADVACRQIEALGFTVTTKGESLKRLTAPPLTPTFTNPLQIELRDVSYRYQSRAGDRNFTLGPINLAMQSGEIIFLTGGNGSGKTTLIKLLTGLYPVQSGNIFWDGQPVTPQTLEQYQHLFAVVFADFYLFDQLLGLDVLDQHAQYYLNKFDLQHKLVIRDGIFSTTELSHGQRKRLALLTAYFENRPIYIFDEWASGQDPEFREVFYRQILPELKARGKLVIVTSHDHTYYEAADRVIRLDYGQVVAER